MRLLSISTDLTDQVKAWIAADPDPITRAELEGLAGQSLAEGLAGDTAELESRFSSTLKFGTAGLRGELGAGPNRMNRVVVRQTTAALMDYLSASQAGGAASKPGEAISKTAEATKIVIGYDGRRNSDVFARDTAAVATAKGGQVILLEGVVPTPVLAHAVLRHGCDVGVMITASHNPPQDNGYKVYWNDGAQIIPPHDSQIERIRRQSVLLPKDFGSDADSYRIISASEEIEEYVQATAEAIKSLFKGTSAIEDGDGAIRLVYTPLHGVGKATLLRLFEVLGLSAPMVVSEQGEPDGNFPTVQFPNPEEPGALDLALKLAEEVDADVVLANDPDADRLCVAIRQSELPSYRVLSGDELGCLLAEGILSLLGKGDAKLLVGTTIVSSQLLAKIAEAHSVAFSETLTGFKWLARAGSGRSEQFVFGYEEALGFSVLPDLVHDKDGITAAAVFVLLMRQSEGVDRQLARLSRQHGLHKSRQISFRYETDGAQITMATIMGSLRMLPPQHIGDFAISSVVDFAEGGSVPANVLVYFLSNGARIIIRPSGTEPKLKAYLEVIQPVAGEDDAGEDGTGLADATSLAIAQLDALETAVRALINERS